MSGILSGVTDSPVSSLALSPEQRWLYRVAIERAGAGTPCSRCGAPFEKFGVAPAQHPIQLFQMHEAIRGVREAQLDTLVLMCVQCGAIYMHSRGVLDQIIAREGLSVELEDDGADGE